MLKPRIPSALTAAAAFVLALGAAQPAAAHGRGWAGRGPHGHGFVADRSISRAPGLATASRGVQTIGGHGFETTRSTTHGDGTLTNNVTRTFDDGRAATRTGSMSRNGNGSVTMERSHTGVAGNTQSGWSTIYRTDDGVGRTRSVATSNGRSATETGNVSFGNGGMTVDRSVTTGSGATASRSTTYGR